MSQFENSAFSGSDWLSYVPQYIVQDLERDAGAEHERRFTAVTLFADVSGFTAISEALGQSGRRGTEELTTILNSYFDPMIQLIRSFGGYVGKFGGDAMTVLFPYDAKTKQAVVRRAIQCALEMQSNMGRYNDMMTSAGVFSLTMKAGLGIGPVYVATVGDSRFRLEYVIAGAALDQCADAEHHAQPGEVVVANALLPFAGKNTFQEKSEEFSVITNLQRRARPKPLPVLQTISLETTETVSSFIHPSVVGRLRLGQMGFVNEHRMVTVLFVRFSGFEYDTDPDVGKKLHSYLTNVIHITRKYDGYLNKVDMGDKGSKYIILFGAPIGHEDDEERAVRCALELNGLPVSVSIGINTGFVFSGQVGSSVRQEYTVMGDPVNLSARLMQAAPPDAIYVSETTRNRISGEFVWQMLPPLTMKGKSEPVQAFEVSGLQTDVANGLVEPRYRLPLIDRDAERPLLTQLISDAEEGNGHILSIIGAAGVGKSRLNAALIRQAQGAGFAVFGGACQSYGQNASYLVWQPIWRNLFELSPDWSLSQQIQQLRLFLAPMDPRVDRRLPLLRDVLNISLPDNNLTEALEPQLRMELLRAFLLDCLRFRARQQPLLLVLEDGQWMDPISRSLLEYLARNIAGLPVLIVLLYRPSDSAQSSPFEWTKQLNHAQTITLDVLSNEESKMLVLAKMSQLWPDTTQFSERLVSQIVEKADGNPFYLEELVNYVHDHELNPVGETAVFQLAIPDSLHSLIISRIDRLTELEQTTLKVASVIGRLFSARWVWGSYPELGPETAVRTYLDTLNRLDLTPLYQPEPELEYLFKQITTQEVAYESLAYATRSRLHHSLGAYLETAYGDNLAPLINVLAFHFGQSDDTDKQRTYFKQAGDMAKAAFANDTAVSYYERLLPICDESEQVAVNLQLGEVWQHIGAWDKAEAAFRDALQLSNAIDDTALIAKSELALASLLLLARSEAADTIFQMLHSANARFQELDDEAGAGQVAEQLGFAFLQRGDYEQSRNYSQQRLHIAQSLDDQVGICTAFENIGLAYLEQGMHADAAENLQHSRSIADEHDYQVGVILANNDLAGAFWQQGDFSQALSYLQQARSAAREIGYKEIVGISAGNAGSVYQFFGESDNALLCFHQALQIANELGDRPNILTFTYNIGYVFAHQQRFDLAEKIVHFAYGLADEMEAAYFLSRSLYLLTEIEYERGNFAQAQRWNEDALTLATETAVLDTQFKAELMAIGLDVKLGEAGVETAVLAYKKLLNTLEDDSERAAVHFEMWRLTGEQDGNWETAVQLYRQLYNQSPQHEFRRRFQLLTGGDLPEPPSLPPPEIVVETNEDLFTLLKRVGVPI